MLRALELARRGVGHVSPNPLVGCVITDSGGQIIGEGAHLEFGGLHAEPNAIADAEAHGHSVEGATVYVTLEPHSFKGKTTPCSQLLISKKIARCVVALVDPYPKVNGEGIRQLRDAGIQVDVGLLQAEAEELNRFFIKQVTTGLPYVTLKLATSLDGRSALATGESKWITSEASRRRVHTMRAEYDAVLVGSRTALLDDPALTVRMVEGRQPWRIVLDSRLELPRTLKVFCDEHRNRTIVVTDASRETRESELPHGIEHLPISSKNDRLDLAALFRVLGARGIASVLVEAGPTLAASIVRERLFDELIIFQAPIVFGGDARAAIGPLGHETLAEIPRLRLYYVRPVEGSHDIEVCLRP
ncbi:MAG: bifunctional diaminohydroxyphosphoribosylaminopyrimidine deaminase/5-amino-6-(5-phosphoribosylamino)uracil reductase RibD [Bacteroidota bacterium]|nr:bifunctional diaminohydroxyphosphoribosylaminopyrimidine deaminase/5-amino-6-(5-phosphoribosylamino)uracil reductase RibD [Bacteroidota bacterium]MDP4242334.1 bifunctional diaminohydroxyphosphoribosylaminopyrimidine deaminase/5-amino-6-(5-phosphoribosylamino)uracil reductase RibD [Bacteroidota bacterium]MDP4288714.1 bifunctional diaminohydroxyphosphoribosylaminopyrimidine deaminase/5-amino-6-(5-phosphoribosylamino)uracil reductase RibD [Bacteroidota bacterium]